MNVEARIAALRTRVLAEGLSAMVISDPTNVAYITGFEAVFDGEDAHAAVVTAESATLYTDARYAEACRSAAEGTPWEIRVPPATLYVTLCEDLHRAGVMSLALEESVPHGRFRFISGAFEGNVGAVDQWVEELRAVKEPEEIDRIEAAQAITDKAFEHILGFIRPGLLEREVALEIECFMRRLGSDGVAFPAIVGSGPNSALPHARPGSRALERGDLVVLDFGARVDGYCADMTRTVVIGPATDRQRDLYEAVLEAQRAGEAEVRAGVTGQQADAAARRVFVERGLGEAFGHGLGHGVGLEVHEAPGVGQRSTKSLHENNVITVEPGAYLPGFGGVRIENLVVVGVAVSRTLTGSSTELYEL